MKHSAVPAALGNSLQGSVTGNKRPENTSQKDTFKKGQVSETEVMDGDLKCVKVVTILLMDPSQSCDVRNQADRPHLDRNVWNVDNMIRFSAVSESQT